MMTLIAAVAAGLIILICWICAVCWLSQPAPYCPKEKII
jgi:hypothetical protein